MKKFLLTCFVMVTSLFMSGCASSHYERIYEGPTGGYEEYRYDRSGYDVYIGPSGFDVASTESYVRLHVGNIFVGTNGITRVDLYHRNMQLYTVNVDVSRCQLDTRLLQTRSFRFAKVTSVNGGSRYFPVAPNANLPLFIQHNWCY